MAIEYFEGKSVEEIPAIVVPYDYVTVNTDDAKAIGVDLDKIDFGTEEVKKVADAQK